MYEYIVNIQETVPKYDNLTNICKSFSKHILPIFQFIAELLLLIQLFCLNCGWSYIFFMARPCQMSQIPSREVTESPYSS